MRVAFVALIIAGSITGGVQKTEEKPPKSKTLWAAISTHGPVYQLPFSSGGDNQFILHFGVVNDGDKTVNPDTESSQLLINGEPLKNWYNIIHNGIKSTYNHALPPGGHLNFTYGMGSYFEKPGIYKVVWKGKGFESPEFTFRVLPRKP